MRLAVAPRNERDRIRRRIPYRSSISASFPVTCPAGEARARRRAPPPPPAGPSAPGRRPARRGGPGALDRDPRRRVRPPPGRRRRGRWRGSRAGPDRRRPSAAGRGSRPGRGGEGTAWPGRQALEHRLLLGSGGGATNREGGGHDLGARIGEAGRDERLRTSRIEPREQADDASTELGLGPFAGVEKGPEDGRARDDVEPALVDLEHGERAPSRLRVGAEGRRERRGERIGVRLAGSRRCGLGRRAEERIHAELRARSDRRTGRSLETERVVGERGRREATAIGIGIEERGAGGVASSAATEGREAPETAEPREAPSSAPSRSRSSESTSPSRPSESAAYAETAR